VPVRFTQGGDHAAVVRCGKIFIRRLDNQITVAQAVGGTSHALNIDAQSPTY